MEEFKLSIKPFVKFVEYNRRKLIKKNWLISFEGNESDLDTFSEAIKELNKKPHYSDFEICLQPIPEYEVDILVKHSSEEYSIYKKLEGKFNWKEKIEIYHVMKTKKDILWDIVHNARCIRSLNDKFFEKSEILPKHYIVLQMPCEYANYLQEQGVKRTAIQYNGNEDEIHLFGQDIKENGTFHEFLMEEIIDIPLLTDHVITGKFIYTKYLERNLREKKNQTVVSAISNDRIQIFIE